MNWRKSRRSVNNGACAEIGTAPGTVLIRDTADRDGVVLAVTGTAWTAFTARIVTAGTEYLVAELAERQSA